MMAARAIRIGMKPPHPGAFIKDEIFEPLGLTIVGAADVLGVRRATVSDLVNGKASLSAEMALRIEKAFGVAMDTLMRMQNSYDIAEARKREADIEVAPFKGKPRDPRASPA